MIFSSRYKIDCYVKLLFLNEKGVLYFIDKKYTKIYEENKKYAIIKIKIKN